MRNNHCDWEIWIISPLIQSTQLTSILKKQHIDGVIGRGLSQELIDCIHQENIALVSIRGVQAKVNEYDNGPHIDDNAIGKIAGSEFMRLNLSYWGFVHWQGVSWSEARKLSFHQYAMSMGCNNSVIELNTEQRASWDGMAKIIRWLKKLPKPCGILACNDEAGIGVLNACHIAGFKVPHEVAVIGVDNDRLLCDSVIPALSSIDLHAAEIGELAALQLRDLLSSNKTKITRSTISQHALLVIRESSHQIDRKLLVYQRAMDYLNARSLKAPSVAEIATACAISRRGLERIFELYAKKSPAEVVREKRLEALIILLKTQPLSLENIALQVGFSDASGLSNFIKRMTGRSPKQIREDR